MRIAAVLNSVQDREEISGILQKINPEYEVVGTASEDRKSVV